MLIDDIVTGTAEKSGLTKKDSRKAFDAIFAVAAEALVNGESFEVPGFGKFFIRESDERQGRNPHSGEDITIPAKNHVVFKPFKALKEAVNG